MKSRWNGNDQEPLQPNSTSGITQQKLKSKRTAHSQQVATRLSSEKVESKQQSGQTMKIIIYYREKVLRLRIVFRLTW